MRTPDRISLVLKSLNRSVVGDKVAELGVAVAHEIDSGSQPSHGLTAARTALTLTDPGTARLFEEASRVLERRLAGFEGRQVVHVLKTTPVYFEAVASGAKPFDLRRDDRGFEVGDQLHLAEWNPENNSFTGRTLVRDVTYILQGEPWLQPGFVALGLGA